MPRSIHTNLLTIALALNAPIDRDWANGAVRQSGSNLRVTEDTALAGRLRAQRLAEVLQAPTRGRQPPTGRLKYILKIHPNADAPRPATQKVAHPKLSAGNRRIPFYLLASLAQAALEEWNRQRSSLARRMEDEIASLEARLLSTRDRNEKKRLADELQTALHSDENMDAEIAKRVYNKLAHSHEPYSDYVDVVDWLARK